MLRGREFKGRLLDLSSRVQGTFTRSVIQNNSYWFSSSLGCSIVRPHRQVCQIDLAIAIAEEHLTTLVVAVRDVIGRARRDNTGDLDHA